MIRFLQAYPHKILTGRRSRMHTIRQTSGLAGFPKRDESIHDAFGVGHSSTSISAGLGMSLYSFHLLFFSFLPFHLKRGTFEHSSIVHNFFAMDENNVGMAVARDILGKKNSVISVIGDGAMTAGQAYEAMNNAGYLDTNMIVILNDNKQVSLPTATLDGPATPVGALSSALTKLQASTKFRKLREAAKVKKNHRRLHTLYSFLALRFYISYGHHNLVITVNDFLIPFFEDHYKTNWGTNT